jgi:hypothetical protein
MGNLELELIQKKSHQRTVYYEPGYILAIVMAINSKPLAFLEPPV